MTHLVEQLRGEAEANIAAMREAALRARDTHARAELMRHMLMTAGKVKEQPVADAVRFIVDLRAWVVGAGAAGAARTRPAGPGLARRAVLGPRVPAGMPLTLRADS